jgi:hypothetical protein
MNFRSNVLLEKLPHSAKLHRLASPHVLIERLTLDPSQKNPNNPKHLREPPADFSEKLREYK